MRLQSLFGMLFCALAFAPAARAADPACANPRQMTGFQTCANVAKAEQEGAFGREQAPGSPANGARHLEALLDLAGTIPGGAVHRVTIGRETPIQWLA